MRCATDARLRAPAMAVSVLLLGLAACAPASPSPAPAQPAPPATPPAAPRPAPTTAPAPPQPEMLTHTIISRAAPYWVTFVGERKGFFQARGVQLDITVTPRIPDAARALAAGSFNTGGFIPDTALLAAGQGAPVTVVGLQTDRGTYRLAVAPDVTTFADLRGKTFAVGATNDVTAGMLRRLLRLNGLGPDEYDLIAVGSTPERYAALTSGQVAGVLLTEPLNLRAEREGFRLIADLAEVLPPFAFGALLVNRDWAQGHRDAVVRWLAGMLESVRWLYAPANRDEAVRVLAEATGASEDDARISYTLAVEQGHVYPADLRATRAHLEALLDLMREVGTAPDPPPDLGRFVDESYLAEAQQLVGAPAR